MKTCVFVIPVLLMAGVICSAAVTLPQPPNISRIASLVDRPGGDGNAADFFLQAEKLYLAGDFQKSPSERMTIDPASDVFTLVLKGLDCRICEFPYSARLTLPPYEQMIPMMALYNAASKTCRTLGDEALTAGRLDDARTWYLRAANMGLHLWFDPGITIIQDLITMAVLSEGVEGLGDLAIARGDADTAAACARFLAEKTRYLEDIRRFMKKTLARPPECTPAYRELAAMFPGIDYLPLKLEVLLFTAELKLADDDPDTQSVCRSVIQTGLKHPDQRIRTLAEWADTLTIEKLQDQLTDSGNEVFD